MRQDLTEIAFILDRSGSMQSLTEAAISGFNSFLKEQQEAEGEARLTLTLFDDEFLYPADALPISEVIGLDTRTYVPRGCTALLDAIGKTIKKVDERLQHLKDEDKPANVVFAIFTDGYENSSLDYTWKDIAKMIREYREKGWEFLFLGANQDAIATASQLNIEAHNSATVAASAMGMTSSTRSISRKMSVLRCANPRNADSQKSMSELVEEENQKQQTEEDNNDGTQA